MTDDGQPGLPPFQLEVARMFFALPGSEAGCPSGSTIVTRAAGWSSAALAAGS
jgi:hypothetical protein